MELPRLAAVRLRLDLELVQLSQRSAKAEWSLMRRHKGMVTAILLPDTKHVYAVLCKSASFRQTKLVGDSGLGNILHM